MRVKAIRTYRRRGQTGEVRRAAQKDNALGGGTKNRHCVFCLRNYLFVGGGVVGGATGNGAGFAGTGAEDAGLPILSNTDRLATVLS